MTAVNLLNQYYPSPSTDQNQSLLSNMYLEKDVNRGKYPMIARSTDGLTLFCNTGQSVVRALYTHRGVLYCVAGNVFGSINSSGTLTNIATLNTSSGFAKIRSIS